MNQDIPNVEITIPAPTVQAALEAARVEVAKAWGIEPDALTGTVVAMEPAEWVDEITLAEGGPPRVVRWDVTVRVSPVTPTRLSEGGRV